MANIEDFNDSYEYPEKFVLSAAQLLAGIPGFTTQNHDYDVQVNESEHDTRIAVQFINPKKRNTYI
jgi:hypothetical protein